MLTLVHILSAQDHNEVAKQPSPAIAGSNAFTLSHRLSDSDISLLAKTRTSSDTFWTGNIFQLLFSDKL